MLTNEAIRRTDSRADVEDFQRWGCKPSHYVADIRVSHLQLTSFLISSLKIPVPGRKKVFWVHLSHIPPPVATGSIHRRVDD